MDLEYTNTPKSVRQTPKPKTPSWNEPEDAQSRNWRWSESPEQELESSREGSNQSKDSNHHRPTRSRHEMHRRTNSDQSSSHKSNYDYRNDRSFSRSEHGHRKDHRQSSNVDDFAAQHNGDHRRNPKRKHDHRIECENDFEIYNIPERTVPDFRIRRNSSRTYSNNTDSDYRINRKKSYHISKSDQDAKISHRTDFRNDHAYKSDIRSSKYYCNDRKDRSRSPHHNYR